MMSVHPHACIHRPSLVRLAALAFGLSFGCGVGAARPAQGARPQTATAASAPVQESSGPQALAWTQAARSLAELRDLEFSLLVDGAPLPLPHATCDERASGAQAFECRAPLPALASGPHDIQIVASLRVAGAQKRSAPSLRLLVVTGEGGQTAAARFEPPPRASATPSLAQMRARELSIVSWATGLDDPRLLASISRDRVLFVSGDADLYSATSSGASRVSMTVAAPRPTRILAAALPPKAGPDARLFVAWAVPAAHRGSEVQIRRYSLNANELTGERAVARVPAPGGNARALMAFGPDGKLYLVVPSSPHSTIYRFNDDGTVPSEHSTHSAMFALGPPEASALAWNPRTSELWCVGQTQDGADTRVFPTRGRDVFASLPLSGQPAGGASATASRRRGQPRHVSSLAFLDRPNAPAADALAVVTDGPSEVIRLSVADNGAVRLTGRYPFGPDRRITELLAHDGTLFLALQRPGDRRGGEVGAFPNAIAWR